MIAPLLTKAVEAEQGKVVLVKVNVDECSKVAGAYGISALPTVVAFKNGKEQSRFIGMKNESQIKEFVRAAHSS
jgi:thioredoxin-like negative regulator of GroEL